MFIRHGEKPADDGPPHGVTHKGQHDPHSLSVRGWTRAGALAGLFAHVPNPVHAQLVVPQRVLATRSTDDYLSRREVQTATPTAHRLGLDVDDSFDLGKAKELSASVNADPRPTLVVWHHGAMAHLLAQFPVANSGDVPAQWPDDRYDLIWVLTREAGQPDYRFEILAQGLLDGDAPAV